MELVRRSAGLTDVTIASCPSPSWAGRRWDGRTGEGTERSGYRIINALRSDARRPVDAVAAEL
jgi:hypothetical protein